MQNGIKIAFHLIQQNYFKDIVETSKNIIYPLNEYNIVHSTIAPKISCSNNEIATFDVNDENVFLTNLIRIIVIKLLL